MKHRALGALLGLAVCVGCRDRKQEVEPAPPAAERALRPESQRPGPTAAPPAAAPPAAASPAARSPAAASPVVAPPTEALPYPVKWSNDLNLTSLADVPAALTRQDPTGFGELVLGAKQVLPTHCKQWAELHQAGYEPSTELEVQADGGAAFQCDVLRLLERARPARLSFVRELPKKGPDLLRILPAVFATAESPERAKRLAPLTQQGASLAAFDPKAKTIASPVPEVTRVSESQGQSLVDIQPKAWGDFNGDGVDDVLMAVRNSMTEGSISTARVLLLTRAAPTEVLRVLEAPGK